ncbi:MAG: protein-glutamate O-methyltransferase CheR [Bacteroidales bacterium]|nr:protein-glutamate O-methyltransferase CheR [Bacteroidales bacterium]
MTQKIRHIIELLLRSHGTDVSKYNDSFLDKSLQKRITETNCSSAEEYYTFLKQNHKEGESFIDSMHNSYSEFFRNPLTYAVLQQIVLPAIVLKKANTKQGEIRIWSVACAAGQEAYSMAILLEELLNVRSEKFSYRIFATDHSELQINQAQMGKFSAYALNNLNLNRVNQWFTKHGDTYVVKPALKDNIDFSVFDLFNKWPSCPPASIFGGFDMIICANLLFYYKNEYQEIILNKAANSLVDDGYLITGETEREIWMNHHFHEIFPQSAIFQV